MLNEKQVKEEVGSVEFTQFYQGLSYIVNQRRFKILIDTLLILFSCLFIKLESRNSTIGSYIRVDSFLIITFLIGFVSYLFGIIDPLESSLK
jgi:hypothetical protein